MAYIELPPKRAGKLLETSPGIILLDVREKWEFELVHINGAVLAPLSNFLSFIPKLSKTAAYLVYCHHGVRSARVCMYLMNLGFENVSNLAGGIEQYAIEVDSSLKRY